MLSIAYVNIIFCQTRNNKSVKWEFGKTKTEQFVCRVTVVPVKLRLNQIYLCVVSLVVLVN